MTTTTSAQALTEVLRMLKAAYRELGMWTDDNRRIVKARAALEPAP